MSIFGSGGENRGPLADRTNNKQAGSVPVSPIPRPDNRDLVLLAETAPAELEVPKEAEMTPKNPATVVRSLGPTWPRFPSD